MGPEHMLYMATVYGGQATIGQDCRALRAGANP